MKGLKRHRNCKLIVSVALMLASGHSSRDFGQRRGQGKLPHNFAHNLVGYLEKLTLTKRTMPHFDKEK